MTFIFGSKDVSALDLKWRYFIAETRKTHLTLLYLNILLKEFLQNYSLKRELRSSAIKYFHRERTTNLLLSKFIVNCRVDFGQRHGRVILRQALRGGFKLRRKGLTMSAPKQIKIKYTQLHFSRIKLGTCFLHWL